MYVIAQIISRCPLAHCRRLPISVDHSDCKRQKMALLFMSRRIAPRYNRPLHRRHINQATFKQQTTPPLRSFSAQPQPSQEEDAVPPFSPPLHSHHHDKDIFSSPNAHSHPTLSMKPRPKIGRLVLVRHGQSEWNVTDPARNLTARFVSLSECITFTSFIRLYMKLSIASYDYVANCQNQTNNRLDGPI